MDMEHIEHFPFIVSMKPFLAQNVNGFSKSVDSAVPNKYLSMPAIVESTV